MKTIVTIIIILMSTAISHAASETINGYTWAYSSWYSSSSEGYLAHITDVLPKTGDVVIPSMVAVNSPNPCLVEKINESMFEYSEITSILIPESVRIVGYFCFRGCNKLETIVLLNPDVELVWYGGVSSDSGNSPFAYCQNIKNITWPGSLSIHNVLGYYTEITNITVTTFSSNIVNECFSRCVSVINVDMPDCVTNISRNAFSGCRSLPHVNLPINLMSLGQGAFGDCRDLTQITLPESLLEIGGSAFASCYSLTNVTFLGNAPKCEEGIFENANRDLVVYVPVGSKGWDGNPESTALPKYWPYNTEGGRRIMHIGETVNNEPPVVTNYVYSTVTNYVFSTVTNEVFHYSTVTNEIFHYTTVTNVVKYVPEPGASPDAGYGINVGAGGETVIAGAAGWDAFGVPNGMKWNKKTGTLSGRAKLSGVYDLILVSGSGADTKIMRTTLTVAPYNIIIGYVGVAFSQSGAPLNNLKSYKTLPTGLKWKNNVLSGVPTKAQTLKLETVDGEPVTIEIKALPDSVVGTFDGCVYFPPSNPTNGVANICDIGGTIVLTATTAGKISASVKTAKKTYSFSMASWAKFAEGNMFALEANAELKTGEALQINVHVFDGAAIVLAKLSGGEFGEDGCVTMLARDVYAKNGSKWIDEEAHGLMAKCAGTYQFGFDAVGDGGHGVTALPAWTLRPVAKVEASFLKVVLKDTGVATITGTLPDKTKVNLSAKATASAVDGSDKVEIEIVSAAFPGKATALPVEIDIMNDGSFAEGRANCGIIYSVKQ